MRRTPATAALILLALLAALAVLAEVHANFEDGTLTVIDDDSVNLLRVWCSEGHVYVNGASVPHPEGGEVTCDQVRALHVFAHPTGSRMDMTIYEGITQTTFPGLQSLVFYGESSPDMVIGSGFGVVGYGDAGVDSFLLGMLPDTCYGGSGDDYVRGGGGDDRLYGGSGDDRLIGGEGNDVLNAEGGGTNHIEPGPGDDWVVGGNESDIIHLNYSAGREDSGVKTLMDEWGEDTLDFSESTAGGTLNLDRLQVEQVVDESGQSLIIWSLFENYLGSPHDDHLTVRPLNAWPRTLDGGAQDEGDVLTIETMGFGYTDDGSTVTVAGYEPIHYLNWEMVIIDETSTVDCSWGMVKQLY